MKTRTFCHLTRTFTASLTSTPIITMKAITCAVIAIACVLGLVVADDYYSFGGYSGGHGGYGGASYVPVYGGYGGAASGGFGQGGFFMLFLFLIFFLFLFNKNNTGTTSFSVLNLTG